MGALVQWGDVGTWLGTGAGIAALFRGLGNRQQVQLQGWAEALEELTELEPEELRRTIEDHPVIAEIVGIAAEEAARAASDHKRYLLAQVAAAALRGDATPGQVNDLLYLARTVIMLDPADLTLLVIMGTTEEGKERPEDSRAFEGDLLHRWPSPRDLIAPAVASLQRAGVIYEVDQYSGGQPSTWVINDYGRLFLKHLLLDLGGWPPRSQLEG